MGALLFNSTDPCVHMAYPTCQRLELAAAASLDRKVQRPEKIGRKKKDFGLGYYTQEVIVLLGLKIYDILYIYK